MTDVVRVGGVADGGETSGWDERTVRRVVGVERKREREVRVI